MSFQSSAVSFINKFPKGSIWQSRYICLPATIIAASIALSRSELSLGMSLFYFILGLFIWTFLEYILHRWVLHYKAKSAIGKAIVARLHVIHHNDPHDKTQVCIPFIMSSPLWVLIFIILILFGGGAQGSLLVTCGVAMMMVIYDIAHYSTHYMPATNWLLKRLKKNHMQHHFSDHTRRFGVTSPIWDFVFRTYQ